MNRQETNLFRSKLGVAAVALSLLVSGCSWMDPTDWFDDDEPALPSAELDQGAEIPNLSQVPSEPRSVSSDAIRKETVKGLTADRANAQYSEEALVAGSGLAQPQVPAPPSQAGTLSGAVSSSTLPQVPSVPTVPSSLQASGGQQTLGSAQSAALPSTSTSAAPAVPQYQAPAYTPPRQSLLAAVIYFAHGSSNLDSQDQTVLRGVVAEQQQRGAQIMVVGHSSSRTGNTSPERHQIANFNMSMKRANTVAAALTRLGVDSRMVTTEARADAQPVYHEFMPTGESGNRRAEIFFLY